ncbi:CPBP family intramembrane glutamic endopeptidase [Seonamhaeicola sp. ML3]|uniref:CPBP family intramembrane glutamic endopeptidase n=1 Tax=Seonamhaeicola sp. ML3 TaxID=2937786 RepID=UPI00200BBC5B|nr:CPBP family intramembrane glutamic endopeptidase [Seonamhaeicola sp. ML3]
MKQYLPQPVIRDLETQKKYRWQTAVTLLILFVVSAIVNIPFSKEIRRLKLKPGEIDPKLSEPIMNSIIEVGISSATLGIVFILLGVFTCRKTYLGTPNLTAIFSKTPKSKYFNKSVILSSILIGTLVAIILLGVFEIQKQIYPVVAVNNRPSGLFYILASFSGAISEEVVFRLGIMSLIVAIIQYLKEVEKPTNTMYWAGIILSSLLFGLIHIPMAGNFFEITAFTIAVTMVGNLITGITFGLIFWRWGLLNAILSHFVFDIVFHVIGTPFS